MDVSLVIPGRNAERTLVPCLDSIRPLLEQGQLRQVVFVDDGSTDSTAEIASRYPIECVAGEGRGPGAARNLGWQAAVSPLVWFIDSDCVAEPDALSRLLEHFTDDSIAGVGGSYGNMRPHSLLATLIHEEIVERHLRMPSDVDFLATFNVVYRRTFLERVGGFDERLLKAQDAELAYRIRKAGGRLRFDAASRVKHFHPDRLGSYLKTQRQQGFWRVWLYLKHPAATKGDAYSGWTDHVQPPLAAIAMALFPLTFLRLARLMLAAVAILLALAQLPMTAKLIRRTRRAQSVLFAPLSFVRAFWRAAGMVTATLRALPHVITRRHGRAAVE